MSTNIIGNFVLVPFLGCKGAAISTGIAYIVFFLMRTTISLYYYKVDYQLWKIGIMIIFTMAFALYNTFYEFNIYTVISFTICICILCYLYKNDIFDLIKYFANEFKKLFRY